MRRILLVGMVALLGGFATGSSSVSFAQSSDEEGSTRR
jgi:hypothetical protein